MSKSHLSPDAVFASNQAEQLALWNALFGTVQHFFGGFTALFAGIHDPRHAAYITYPLAAVLSTGLLLFLFRLGARRQIDVWLRDNAGVAAKFAALFGVAQCPDNDTVHVLCRRLKPAEVQEAQCRLVERLIRTKVLHPFRLLDYYWVVAIDGTGVLTFAERHCEHCLTRTHRGQTLYYHPVLEAKLVSPNGFTFSLMTEFIENPGEHPTKQDCELKAFYRLAARLKQRFPRLPLCLSLDALFAGGPTFALCARYDWRYVIVLQADDLPSVHREFVALTAMPAAAHLRLRTGAGGRITQVLDWVNDIAYVDSERREHQLNVLRCVDQEQQADGTLTTTRFMWITNLTVKANQAATIANQGGRIRWKAENEGFNVQKNGGFALEHIYSHDRNAAQVLYLLLQMAHLLFQLVCFGSLLRQAFPRGVGSARDLARRLLEAWRNLCVSAEELLRLRTRRFQVRFDSS